MKTDTRTYFVTRGICLFVGLFSLVNVIACLLGNAANQNAWWIDLSLIAFDWNNHHIQLGFLLELIAAVLMIAWAFKPKACFARRLVTVIAIIVLAVLLFGNAISYGKIYMSGQLYKALPIPLTLVFCVTLSVIAVRIARSKEHVTRSSKGAVHVVVVALVTALVFPLLQICFFGCTDYRRDADCVVVLGARVYEDGTLSPALQERMDTAIELIEQGYAPVLIVSGGIEEGGIVDEAQAMHDYAVAQGIPSEDIIIDRYGDSTQATAQNTIQIAQAQGFDTMMVTSSFYHMPRIKMLYNLQGVDVLTVPTIGDVAHNGTVAALPREIPAWWYYWLKGAFKQ